jgi:molecular chaperone GrpE
MEKEKEQRVTPLSKVQGQREASEAEENSPVDGEAGAIPESEKALETSLAYEKLKEEQAALYDRLLRKQAEFENYRKRVQREKEEFRHHATESVMRDLLPVLDAFERALKRRAPAIPASFYEGMELIHHQLLEALGRAGLQAIETEGQLFDPHYHQAVETIEDDDRRDQEIVEELQRGYNLEQRLLRPAIVRVAVNSKAAASEAQD